MKIQYTTKNVYGNDLNYPANPDAAMICELTGRKTLSVVDLEILRRAGHELLRVM